jgi:ubiquinone/menaquinone biosynthesis C-methylase UbiE
MNDQNDPIAAHYGIDGLCDGVISALLEAHGSLEHLTATDLAPIDNFHIRGRASTKELARLVGILSRWEVLDLGSGPGGTARHLAAEHDCQVTGLDLTEALVSLAKRLSEIIKLGEKTRFACGNALSIPFKDDSFDCLWMEHVQMNIADKNKLVLEIGRVLKPGGRLAMHEVFKPSKAEPHLPVPWSDNAATSFMTTPAEMRQTLQDCGFEILEWRDVTHSAREWFRSIQKRMTDSWPPTVGIHLLMGSNARDKMLNLSRNLQEDRLKIIQAVAAK